VSSRRVDPWAWIDKIESDVRHQYLRAEINLNDLKRGSLTGFRNHDNQVQVVLPRLIYLWVSVEDLAYHFFPTEDPN
jgi:hypothetical protein